MGVKLSTVLLVKVKANNLELSSILIYMARTTLFSTQTLTKLTYYYYYILLLSKSVGQ
jgi:hypothetical protein